MKQWKAVPYTDYTWDVRDEKDAMVASNLNYVNAQFIVKIANEKFGKATCLGKETPDLDI